MANYSTYLTGYRKCRTEMPLGGNLMLYKVHIDFSIRTLDAGNGDVEQFLQVPAKSTVLKAWINVLTAAPSNATCDLGYGGDVDQWLDAGALDSTGVVEATVSDVPIYFASVDTIDIKATTDVGDADIVSGVVDVYVMVLLDT